MFNFTRYLQLAKIEYILKKESAPSGLAQPKKVIRYKIEVTYLTFF